MLVVLLVVLAKIDPMVWAGAGATVMLALVALRKLPTDIFGARADAASKTVTSSLAIAERLEVEVAGLRTEMRETREEYRREIKRLRDELAEVRAERDELRRENTALRKTVDEQAARIAALEDEVHGSRGT